jgi:hypothetical protein
VEKVHHQSYTAKVQPVKPGQPGFIRRQGREVKPRSDTCDWIQASVLVHAIDNLICCIRLHASALSANPQARQMANEILIASREVETKVKQLASFVK